MHSRRREKRSYKGCRDGEGFAHKREVFATLDCQGQAQPNAPLRGQSGRGVRPHGRAHGQEPSHRGREATRHAQAGL
jgi:hypothetical protein